MKKQETQEKNIEQNDLGSSSKKGVLYSVSTPIGNLEDITYRAVRILKSVDCILCEDTRTSKKLLNYYEITTPLQSYHEFSMEKDRAQIIYNLKHGMSFALISDAGTPLISDPGFTLLRSLHDQDIYQDIYQGIYQGISVIPIPGVSSLCTALSVSTVPISSFLFLGFVPKIESKCEQLFKMHREHTLVFFDSPKRINQTLKILYRVCKEGDILVAREMTKHFETYYHGKLSQLIQNSSIFYKGEFTVIYRSNFIEYVEDHDILNFYSFLKHMDKKDCTNFIAKWFHIKKQRVYNLLVHHSDE